MIKSDKKDDVFENSYKQNTLSYLISCLIHLYQRLTISPHTYFQLGWFPRYWKKNLHFNTTVHIYIYNHVKDPSPYKYIQSVHADMNKQIILFQRGLKKIVDLFNYMYILKNAFPYYHISFREEMLRFGFFGVFF